MTRERDLLPDWFVGGAGKRRLLMALTDETSPLRSLAPPWSGSELARAAALHEKHTVKRHLEVLQVASLLTRTSEGWTLLDSPLVDPLASYLQAVDMLPPRPLPPSRGR